MAEQETYTTEQSYVPPSTTTNPDHLELRNPSNIDIKYSKDGAGVVSLAFDWDVVGIDAGGDGVELVPPGEMPQINVKTKANKTQMATAFAAAAADVGVTATGAQILRIIEKGCLKAAKALRLS